MILSTASLIALAMHLSNGASVNDIRVYNSLSVCQKKIVLELIDQGNIPDRLSAILLESEQCDDTAEKPATQKHKPGTAVPDETQECYENDK